MPWTGASFRKKNRSLSAVQSAKAAKQANAVLKSSGDEGLAIAVANKHAKGYAEGGEVKQPQSEGERDEALKNYLQFRRDRRDNRKNAADKKDHSGTDATDDIQFLADKGYAEGGSVQKLASLSPEDLRDLYAKGAAKWDKLSEAEREKLIQERRAKTYDPDMLKQLGEAKGGVIKKVAGKPVGKDDGIIAAQRGEFVVKKDAVKKLGVDTLKEINKGRLPSERLYGGRKEVRRHG